MKSISQFKTIFLNTDFVHNFQSANNHAASGAKIAFKVYYILHSPSKIIHHACQSQKKIKNSR